jgi:hypothetical protein
VSLRRTCELQPFIRKAKPDKPVLLGPSEAGELAATIGLQAQLVAHCEAWKSFSVCRHAGRDYTPISHGWCRANHTRVCPRNKLSQGLTEAMVAGNLAAVPSASRVDLPRFFGPRLA